MALVSHIHRVNNAAAANDTYVPESKHVPARDVREVAVELRRDIAAAIKSGALPAGLRTSVRIERFAGGCSCDIRVTAVPAGFVVMSTKRVRQDIDSPHDFSPLPRYTPAAAALLATLERFLAAYNRDRSEIAVDYFDVSFYGHASFAHEIEDAQRREIEAVIRAARA